MAALAALPLAGGASIAGSRASLGAMARVATVAFLAGGLAGAGLYAVLAPPPASRVVYVDRPAPPPLPPPPPAAPAPPPVVAAPAAPSAPAAQAPSSLPSRSSQLSAERVLLDEARAALAQGDPDRALDRLERHRRTFAAPILGEERDAMRVEALAKASRGDEARAAAAAFRKRWPDSLFASAVQAAVESVP